MLWVDKYRPVLLTEFKGHDSIKSKLERLSFDNLPHLLLSGPPGSGKSSAINVVTRTLYAEQWQNYTLIINASDSRSIKTIRETITSFVESEKSVSTFSEARLLKLVILEEADNLTHDAQSCLRSLIEKYSSTSRFILLANYVHLILPAIQSRCSRWRFSPLDHDDVFRHLLDVASQENMTLHDDVADEIARFVNGDMRKAVSVLQALKSCRIDNHSDLQIVQTLLTKPGRLTEKQLLKILEDCISNCYTSHKLAEELWECFESSCGGSCEMPEFLRILMIVICSTEALKSFDIDPILDLLTFSIRGCSNRLVVNALAAQLQYKGLPS